MHGTLADLVDALDHQPVIVFAGAGVAIWDPSNLPLAAALTHDIFGSLAFAAGYNGASAVGLGRVDFPRLEYVFDELTQVIGTAAVRFLDPLDSGQPSGYLVLRLLAEDLGRDLDTVLDAILRALSHRASSRSAAPLHFIRGGRA